MTSTRRAGEAARQHPRRRSHQSSGVDRTDTSPPLSPDAWGVDVLPVSGPSGVGVRVRRAPYHWLQADAGSDADDASWADQLQQTLRDTVPAVAAGGALREVVLVGDGAAAEAIGRQLIARPAITVVLGHDPSHPAERPADWQTALLAQRRPGRRPARWTDAQPEDAWRPPSVVVVATAGAEPDRVLVRRLALRGADHVIVRVHQGVALVGPWVSPGSTACLECHDHWLAAHDTGYARVLNDLEQRRAVTDDSSLAWAAAVVARALTSPDAGHCALADHIEVSDPYFPTLRGLPVAPHPSCRCGAAGHAAATI